MVHAPTEDIVRAKGGKSEARESVNEKGSCELRAGESRFMREKRREGCAIGGREN